MASQTIKRVLLEIKLASPADAAKIDRALQKINARTRQSRRDFAAARKEIDRTTDTSAKLSRELRKLAQSQEVDVIATEFRRATSEGEDLDKTLKRIAADLDAIGASDAQIKRVARSLQQVSENTGAARGGRRGVNPLLRAGSAIFRSPTVQVGGGLPAAVAGRALSSLGRLNVSMGQLAAGAGIAAPLVIGVALAVSTFVKSLRENKQALENALRAQDNYFAAVQNFTSENVTNEVDELTANNKRIADQIAELSSALGPEKFQLPDLGLLQGIGEGFQSVGQAGLDLVQGTGQIRDRFDELTNEYNANEQASVRLTQGLVNQAFATNDAAAAAELFASRVEARNLIAVNTSLRTFVSAQNLSSDAIRERIQAINLEIVATKAVVAAGVPTQGILDSLTDKLFELQTEGSVLEQQVLKIVSVRERETEAIELQKAATLKAIQDQADAEAFARSKRDRAITTLIAVEQKASASIEKLTESIANITTKLSETIATIQQRLADRTAKARQSFANAIEDIEFASAERRLKVAEKFADARFRILRKFNRTFTQAVGERDALAARQAIIARDSELEDADRARDKESRELLRSNANRLRILRRRLSQELASAQEAATRGIQLAREKAQRAIAIARVEIAQQQAILVRAVQRRQQILQQSATNTVQQATFISSVTAQLFATISAQAQRALLLLRIATTGPGLAPTRPPGSQPGTPFASGAFITQSGQATVHRNELILNQPQQMALGIDIGLKSKMLTARVNKAVDKRINVTLKRAGDR